MNWRASGLSAWAAITLLAGPLWAQEPSAPSPTPATTAAATPALAVRPLAAAPRPSGAGSSIQLALYMVLLVALLGGGFYVMRNGFAFLQPKPKGVRKLDITETRGLGNRQFLLVAEYENRKMLIGVCPGRIEYLCTLSGAEPEFPQLAAEDEK